MNPGLSERRDMIPKIIKYKTDLKSILDRGGRAGESCLPIIKKFYSMFKVHIACETLSLLSLCDREKCQYLVPFAAGALIIQKLGDHYFICFRCRKRMKKRLADQ